MHTDYGQVFRDAGVAAKYEHVVYAPHSYSSIISARQRRYLRRLVRTRFPQRRPVQHDFACGTGRVVRILHGLVRDAHGYDTSAAMLAHARTTGLRAHWHEVAAAGPVPQPVPAGDPVVVTVFRLLLNVSEEVRERAVTFAAKALPSPDAGLLVVENHGGARSLRHLRHRRRAGQPWFAELSHRQVAELLARHGFRVLERQACALLPRAAYRVPLLGPLLERLDTWLCRARFLSRYAIDVLYVAQRVGEP